MRRCVSLVAVVVLLASCDALVGIRDTHVSDSGAAAAGTGGTGATAGTGGVGPTGGTGGVGPTGGTGGVDASAGSGGTDASAGSGGTDASTDAAGEDHGTSPDGTVDGGCGGSPPICPGYRCSNGTMVSSAQEQCVNGTWQCTLTKALYWYLDADGDGYVQPLPGLASVLGPILFSYNYGPTCSTSPPSVSGLPATHHWISSTYDWAKPADRAADPKLNQLSPINAGFDCCDAQPDAFPGESQYFQAPSHAPIAQACTSAGVKAWDFNCDGVLQRRAPDNSNTKWDQCASCGAPGWDTLFTCPRDCGDTGGHWITGWSLCVAAGVLANVSPLCH